ncbi:MAG: ABC transporter ATP-binding protein [candidate division NC10 bacterium]|nr:ABC transporter ATP-binding protein [candidate division NC10 bacterium]
MISVEDVGRTYLMGPSRVEALRGVTFSLAPGDFLAICGPSGSGKSTLMNILGCLDRPTTGRYVLEGVEVDSLDDDALATLRNGRIGFVFQTFNLLPRMTALRNVELPMIYGGLPREDRRRRALEALAAVGLEGRITHCPSELSGGEQQRVAVARALVNRPAIILADEPTGNLDSRAGQDIVAVFHRLVDSGVTLIMVTHNSRLAEQAHRVIHLEDGRMVSDSAPHPRPLPPSGGEGK